MTHLSLFYYMKTARSRLDDILVEAYLHHTPLPYQIGIIPEEKRYAGKLHRQSQIGMDYIAVDGIGIEIARHARRYVDAHHRGRRLVDIPHQHLETTLKTLAQTRSEQTVYHYRVGRQFRKLQLILDLYEIDLTARRKHLVAERPAVERQHLAADIEQIHRRTVALTHHYGGYRQSVGTIIARTGKKDERTRRTPSRHDLVSHAASRTFYQFARRDAVYLHGAPVDRSYIFGGEYLHRLCCSIESYGNTNAFLPQNYYIYPLFSPN